MKKEQALSKLSIKDLPIQGKKVLMRVDFNVPLDESGNITDDQRIAAALPSIKYVLDQGGSLILMTHLGRPKNGPTASLSLAPCAKRLSELLHKPVLMAPDCIGKSTEDMAKALQPGQILMLENLRFHAAEESPEKDPEFAKQLAQLGDLYVNDAFGTAHRAHASTAIIAKYFPEKSAAGLLMEKEISVLSQLLENPPRPFYAIIGGAKVSSKLAVLNALLRKVDGLFIGGGMAYTFLKSQGIAIGNSLHEDSLIDQAQEILNQAKQMGIPIYLPIDTVVVQKIDKDAAIKIVETKAGIPSGYQGVDIGPKTIAEYTKLLKQAKTLFWNGPMGVFEIDAFAKGTHAIAQTLADAKDALTIVGGGESVAALQAADLADQMTHVSSGGGAALEFIELGTLPGVEALSDA